MVNYTVVSYQITDALNPESQSNRTSTVILHPDKRPDESILLSTHPARGARQADNILILYRIQYKVDRLNYQILSIELFTGN